MNKAVIAPPAGPDAVKMPSFARDAFTFPFWLDAAALSLSVGGSGVTGTGAAGALAAFEVVDVSELMELKLGV